jgi:hypothetical protein
VKKYIVKLTVEQRQELSRMIATGTTSARQLTHARMLLKADQGPHGPVWSDAQIQEALEVSSGTVGRVRKRCAQAGVQEAILPAADQRIRRRRLDGRKAGILDRFGLRCAARRLGTLDVASARSAVGRIGVCGNGQP